MLVFLLFFIVLCVKQSDFKKCNDSFCKRQRKFHSIPNKDIFTASFQVENHVLQGKLKYKNEEFKANFGFSNGSIRFLINGKIEQDDDEWEFTQTKDDLTVNYYGNELIIQFKPFSFKVNKNDKTVIEFNPQNSLFIESNSLNLGDIATGLERSSKNNNETTVSEWSDLKAGLGQEWFNGKYDSKPYGAQSIGIDFTFPGSKNVYGIPEHASSFSLKSTNVNGNGYSEPYRLYNLDVFEYILDSPMALYGSIPFLLSHSLDATVAVAFLNPSEMWVDIEKTTSIESRKPETRVHWMAEAGQLNFYIFLGPTQEAIFDQYTFVTGRPQLPQYFAISYHQCRWNYNTEQDVLSVNENFNGHGIPYDVLWLDIEHTDMKKYFTWDTSKFPNPSKMQKTLSSDGRKMVTIIDPHIKKDDNYAVSKKAKDLDIFIKDKNGNIFDGYCWPGDSNWIDYSNPKASEFWADLFRLENYKESTLDLYTWNDMNEPSVFSGPEITFPKDVIHHGNIEHRLIHNEYGMLLHGSSFKGHLKRSQNNDRPFILSRAFYAGSQKFGAIWTGDNIADWSHLEASVPMLLSISISGLSFAGADVGGFFGNPDAELLLRWYQMGAFQPFFRAHAHIDSKRREPWLFGADYTRLIRQAIINRYQLLPYIYTLFHESSINGNPVMRSMMQNFPMDENTFEMDDQFMLGNAILMKPVSKPGQQSIQIYLPKDSTWYSYQDFQPLKMKDSIYEMKQLKLETIPVFIKGGSIIARKDRIRKSSSLMIHDPFTLLVALDRKGQAQGTVYVDDGKSFAYTNNAFVKTDFKFQNNILSSNVIQSSKEAYNTEIERIIILGLFEIKTVLINGKKAEFKKRTYHTVIKKPKVLIGSEFRIEFQ